MGFKGLTPTTKHTHDVQVLTGKRERERMHRRGKKKEEEEKEKGK